MKGIHFNIENDGFYGTYYENKKKSDCTIIGLFGDDPNDLMAKCGAKWLHKQGVNVLAMSPGKKNYSHVNCPIERIQTAINWLKIHGSNRFGIMGMSTAGMHALVAASLISDITLTIGLTPSDFVWQGFEQGNRDGCKEWPVEGKSTLSWEGKPLPYMPFVYKHPDYWNAIQKETKGSGNFMCSRSIFDDSEKSREHTDEEMIKVENINGMLVLVAAEDDTLWDAAKYVRRMESRLKEKGAKSEYEVVIYEHGTHFVLPESMLRMALPIGLKFVLKFVFKAAKDFPKECEQTRIDIDHKLSKAVQAWKARTA